MKKLILFSVILAFICSFSGLSQTNNQIVLNKKRYYQGDKKLTNKELQRILMSNPESAAEYKIAKKNGTIGTIPMVAGTALCLYGAFAMLKSSIDETNALNNGEYYEESTAYVAPILIGAGLVVVGIPFALSSIKHTKKSISIYNTNQTTGYREIQKLEFGLTQNGVGITYRF
ncbi:hypothetical protein MASR2M47_16010 [Draconibacterium sp.]